MDKTVLPLISQFGIVPTMLLLVVVVWFLLREIQREVKAVRNQLLALQSHSDRRDGELKTAVEAVEDRLGCVEREYVSREEHYKDLGGWREEMRELRRLLMGRAA